MASSSACFWPCESSRQGSAECAVQAGGLHDRERGRRQRHLGRARATGSAARGGCARRAARRARSASSNTLAVWNLRPMPSRTQAYGGRWPMSWSLIATSPDERSAAVAHAAHQRGLAGAVGADQREQLAVPRLEARRAAAPRGCRSLARHAGHLQARARPRRRPGPNSGCAAAGTKAARRCRLVGSPAAGGGTAGATAGSRPARHHHDDGHEGHADDQFPDEGQVAAQVGRADVDQQRAEHRPDHRAAAAERHPDDASRCRTGSPPSPAPPPCRSRRRGSPPRARPADRPTSSSVFMREVFRPR